MLISTGMKQLGAMAVGNLRQPQAGLLEFEKTLKKCTETLKSVLSNYEVEFKIIGPSNIRTGSDSEIKKLTGGDYINSTGKVAISRFKKRVLENVATGWINPNDINKASQVLDKIGGLFQDKNFSKVIYMQSYSGSKDSHYLMGVNNGKLIGIMSIHPSVDP